MAGPIIQRRSLKCEVTCEPRSLACYLSLPRRGLRLTVYVHRVPLTPVPPTLRLASFGHGLRGNSASCSIATGHRRSLLDPFLARTNVSARVIEGFTRRKRRCISVFRRWIVSFRPLSRRGSVVLENLRSVFRIVRLETMVTWLSVAKRNDDCLKYCRNIVADCTAGLTKKRITSHDNSRCRLSRIARRIADDDEESERERRDRIEPSC